MDEKSTVQHEFIKNLYMNVFKAENSSASMNRTGSTRRTCGLKFDKLTSVHGMNEELFNPWTNNELAVHLGSILTHVVGKQFIGTIDPVDVEVLLTDLCESNRQKVENIYEMSSYYKSSRLFLVVHIVEARELADKDVNGLSDPYCVLGIVLGHDEPMPLPPIASCSSDNISSLVPKGSEKARSPNNRRLGGSFSYRVSTKDSIGSVGLGKPDASRKPSTFKDNRRSVKDVRQTSVKPQTLNPVWDEQFQLEVDDLTKDQLYLDIWDHDEETSVIDAVRSLNEVRGVKQLGRYFKQVSQTARKGQTGDVDDFLGCITVDLKDLPLHEVDKWFKLEGRSTKSKVQGEIHVRLKLTTVEDGSDESKIEEMKDHIKLLYRMLLYELKRSKKPSTEWNGVLSNTTSWFLEQHAFQSGLSELQIAMCSWVCYSKLYRKMPIDCSIVLTQLQTLANLWFDKGLKQEHLTYLTKSFEAFTEHALMLITQCRVVFSQERPESLAHFKNLLSCLQALHNSRPFQFCLPFSTTLQCELTSAFKKRASTNYELFKKPTDGTEENMSNNLLNENIRRILYHLNNLNDDLEVAKKVYAPILQKQVGVFLLDLLHRTYSLHLRQDLFRDEILKNLVTNALHQTESKQEGVTKARTDDHTFEQSVTELFSLFHSIQIFEAFGNSSTECDETESEHFDWYSWFQPVLCVWVRLCAMQLKTIIEKDLQDDQLTIPLRPKKSIGFRPRDGSNQVTSSQSSEPPKTSYSTRKLLDSMDAMLLTWVECKWPDLDSYGSYAKMVLETLFDSVVAYARELHEKLRLKGYCDEEGQFDISHQLCVALSNLDRVIIWAQSIPERCGWSRRKSYVHEQLSELSGSFEESGKIDFIIPCLQRIPQQSMRTLYEIQRSGVIEIRHVLDRIFYRVTAKMRPEIRKNVYHFCWCASTSPTEKALNDLLVYLESNFDTLRWHVSPSLLRRCFLEVWSECLEQFIEQAHKEAEVAPGIGGPGAFLNPSNSPLPQNTCVIPLSTHFTEAQSAVATKDIQPETVLKAKATLLKLKHATELLVQFFMRTTNGLLETYELKNETYQDINYLIQLYVSSTPELVELYFIEKMEEQDKTFKSSYGTLSVSAYFEKSELIVEVRHASGLVPLDSNGLSDPFVVVDLLPQHIFATPPRQMRTRVVKNSLDPVFNDQFEFCVSEDELKHPSACVAFVVMDHDILLSDDLEGVSFLRLSSLFESKCYGSSKSMPSLKCVLQVLHPTHKKYSAFRVLGRRPDPYAQEVYKRWQPMEQDGSG